MLFPHALKKSLGQHFLTDPTVCQKMVAELATSPSDGILEIGPGAGALTRELEHIPHNVLLLLEKDSYWARVRQKEADQKTQCINQDALTFAFCRINHWIVVGNLPYNIASPLLWNIVATCSLKAGLFMVQKEVATRLCAQPCSKAYGALSIWIQSFVTPRLCFCVAPGAFHPKPKVDSAVVAFTPQSQPLPSAHQKPLSILLNACFQRRRKQMGTIAKQANLPRLKEALEEQGIAPTRRPEELTLQDFHALAAFFARIC